MLMMAVAVLCVALSACGSSGESPSSAESGTPAASSSMTADPSATESDPFVRLAGTFYIDGDTSASHVTIGEDGSFTAYYASGTVEQRGIVRYEANESAYVYVFYTDEGKPYMGFIDTGENQIAEFETGNGSFRYVRVGN